MQQKCLKALREDFAAVFLSNLMTLFDLDEFLDMPPVKRGRRGVSGDEDDEEYRKKRERNNEVSISNRM